MCCYNSFHSSWKAFHQILEPGCRDMLPFSHKSINEFQHCFWVMRPGLFQFSCWLGLRSGLCAVQSNSSMPNSENHFFTSLALCTLSLSTLTCWNRKGSSPSCCHKVGSTLLSYISLYTLPLRIPLIKTVVLLKPCKSPRTKVHKRKGCPHI